MIKIKDTRIVIGRNATFNERRAAAWISKYIRIATGCAVPTVNDETAAVKNEIIVGRTARPFDCEYGRHAGGAWEYKLFEKDGSFYLSGLGLAPEKEPPFTSSYRIPEDGCMGTVIASYRFAEKILGCDFLNEAFTDYPMNPELAIPDGFYFDYTRERLLHTLPEVTEGPLVCCLNVGCRLDWNMSGSVLKTASGKLIVIDGGHPEDAEHLVEVIEKLADGKKPVISAWLFSHLHGDHYGAIVSICKNPELASRLEVENFYHHLLSEAYYTTTPREKASADIPDSRRTLLEFDKYFRGCRVHSVNAGDVITVDDFSFEVIRVPSEDRRDDMDYNDTSVVYRMDTPSQSWMWLGDAEWVANNEMLELPEEKLKADVVQVGHHGCGNVDKEIYRRIGAKAAIWHTGPRFLYSERGEGLNTHNTGVIRTRYWLRELGVKPENDYTVMDDLLTVKLPLEIQ